MSLCPEDELFLYLVRTAMDAEMTARAKALMRGDINWGKLLRRALQHRVAPLLYPHLASICPEGLPPQVLTQWREHFEANAVRNLQLASHLVHLLTLLRAHGVLAVPFKGPVLAAMAYNGLERRACGDLDILVHPHDTVRARDVLMAHGYRPKVQGMGRWHASYLRYAYEASLVHPGDGVCVDLHWRLTGNAFPFPLHPEHIQHRLQPVTLLGRDVYSLPADDLLLYLCVHGAKHFWCHLGWLCDVAALIRHEPEMISEPLMARARSLGSERILALGLAMVQRFMHIRLPHDLAQHVHRDSRVLALAAEMGQGLLDQTYQTLGRVDTLLLKCRMRERFRDRGRQVLHWVVQMLRPNRLDRAMITLPTVYDGLYYGLRPIRLIRTYGMKPLRHLLRIPGILFKTLR